MTIYEIVNEVLKEYPKTRDYDFLLCVHVYLKLGFAHRIPLGIVIHYNDIDKFPAFETISRIRRVIQNNEQRLRASPEIENMRHNREVMIHTIFSSRQAKFDTFPKSYLY